MESTTEVGKKQSIEKLLLKLESSIRSETFQLRLVLANLNRNFLTSLGSFHLNQKLPHSTFFPTTRSPMYDLHRSNVTFDPRITNLVVKLDERKVQFLSHWIVCAVYVLNSELQFDWLKRNQIFHWPIYWSFEKQLIEIRQIQKRQIRSIFSHSVKNKQIRSLK